MRHKLLAFVLMNGLAIILVSALDIALAGAPSATLLAASWLVVVAVNLAAARHVPTARLAWKTLAWIEGSIAAIVAAVAFAMPVVAASFEPGPNWQSLDLAPPLAARLREAVLSGYFAITMLAIVAALFAIAYLLPSHAPRHRHHAH